MLKLFSTVVALLLSQILLLTGHGMQLTLLPLRAALEGFSPTLIGMTGTAYFLGFTVGCLVTPRVARRAGHIRTFAVLASLGSVFVLIFPLLPEFWVWLALRFGAGWCIAGLYTLMESWLNERASNRNRGSVMAVYTLINMSMIMMGQMLINLADVSGPILFAVASILFSAALVPVALSTDAPAPIRDVRIQPSVLWRTSHVACTGSLLAGAATGAFWGLAPIYASGVGLDTFQVTLFIAAAVGGGAASQIPLGRLSDRLDRRIVILGAAGVAAASAALLALVPAVSSAPPLVLLGGLSVLFGAFVMPLYALSVAHANDRANAGDFVAIGSGVLMLFGLGSAIGAPLAGLSTAWLGSSGLFAFVTLALVLLMAGVAWRRRVRAAPVQQTAEQPFVAVSDLAPLPLDLDPRVESREGEARPDAGA